jgi:hypothetical protein
MIISSGATIFFTNLQGNGVLGAGPVINEHIAEIGVILGLPDVIA